MCVSEWFVAHFLYTQGVLIEESPVTSSYTFEYCSLFSSSATNRGCVTYSTAEVEIAPMVPAFLYKYEVRTTHQIL